MEKYTLEIQIVNNQKSLNEFIRLPWKIYNNNPHWVPPLIRDIEFKLNRAKNPYFEHSKMELFLCIHNNEILGSIAAVINHRHNEIHNENTAFFGMFECVNDYDVARLLFLAVEEWCNQEGVNRIRGPLSLSIDDECGFLIENFSSDPVIMMPYNPPYYSDFCESYGFKKLKDLYAYYKNIQTGVPNRITKIANKVKKKGNVIIRPINMKRFENEVTVIMDIYNAAFQSHWGFVPLTYKEINQMLQDLRDIIEPDMFLFAEVERSPVAIGAVLPNYNEVLKRLNGKTGLIGTLKFLYYKRKIKSARAFFVGVRKEYRRMGIEFLLFYESEKTLARLGYQWYEMSWTLEDNFLINHSLKTTGAKIYKKYRIYEKKTIN